MFKLKVKKIKGKRTFKKTKVKKTLKGITIKDENFKKVLKERYG